MKLDILLPLKFNHPFTYQSDLNVKLKKGDYVVVPFRNKKITGVVWDLDPKVPSNIKIKKIISNLDIPAMSISNLNFIKKFSHYNLTSLGMVFKLFLYTKGLDSCHKKFNFEQFIIKNFNNKKLNKIQQQSIKSINKYFSFNDYSTTLLHGITGSGKTLVYFHYIKEAIEKGYQILVYKEIFGTTNGTELTSGNSARGGRHQHIEHEDEARLESSTQTRHTRGDHGDVGEGGGNCGGGAGGCLRMGVTVLSAAPRTMDRWISCDIPETSSGETRPALQQGGTGWHRRGDFAENTLHEDSGHGAS